MTDSIYDKLNEKLCGECTSKGSCCSGFALNIGQFSKTTDWISQVMEIMKTNNLPFIPRKESARYDIIGEYFYPLFDCPNLENSGLCGDYLNRPEVCKLFTAASDPLCNSYQYHLKGIPIKVEYSK